MKGFVQELSYSDYGGGYAEGGGVHAMWMYVHLYVCICVYVMCELHVLINQHQSKAYQWVLLRVQQAPGHAD